MSNELDEALRILKSKKITKGTVAKSLAITPGYLSKIIAGEYNLSPKLISLFNKLYGKHGVQLDQPENFATPHNELEGMVVNEDSKPYKTGATIGYDLHLKKTESLRNQIRLLEKQLEDQQDIIANLNQKLFSKSGILQRVEDEIAIRTKELDAELTRYARENEELRKDNFLKNEILHTQLNEINRLKALAGEKNEERFVGSA